MELEFTSRSGSGLVDRPGVTMLTGFHPPILHNQHVSPAVVLLQGCWPVTEPVRRFWRDSCLHDVTRRRVCSLWAKISGVGTNRAGNSGRGLPGAPGAGCGTGSPPSPRRSCGWNPWPWGGFAKANSAVSPQRRGVPVRSPGRELAGYANAVQLGRLPRPFRGSRRYRNNSRQIREIRFCSAGVRSGFTAAAVRRSS